LVPLTEKDWCSLATTTLLAARSSRDPDDFEASSATASVSVGAEDDAPPPQAVNAPAASSNQAAVRAGFERNGFNTTPQNAS
jgi:hypothetical protein